MASSSRWRGPPPEGAPPPLRGFRQVEISVDLHGMRVRTAIPKLDHHLRLCHSAAMHVAHVIHGHGTGALRQAVHEALDGHPLVARHYPASYGQGGDGVTIVELDHGSGRRVRRRSDDAHPTPAPSNRRTNGPAAPRKQSQ